MELYSTYKELKHAINCNFLIVFEEIRLYLLGIETRIHKAN